MRKYQYDTEADIYDKLCDIERLLQVVVGLKSLERYVEEEDMRRNCCMEEKE